VIRQSHRVRNCNQYQSRAVREFGLKQVLQDLRKGTTEVIEVPAPRVKPGHILIGTSCSLISAGTERMLLEFGRANLIRKTWKQPEKVGLVLDKIRTDGILTTLEAVGHKLDQPLPLGYCNVGNVLEVGAGVVGFARGDRVASNGGHAEVVQVPANLCAKIPDHVSDDEAAFTIVGAVALQGIRLAKPTLAETVVVTGLGLVGLVTVQLLKAHGCRVLGIDIDHARLELAASLGATVVDLSQNANPISAAVEFSRGRGVDAVIITASTESNEPVEQAAHICRKRGRIVLVGVAGLKLKRVHFYEKELTLQVSCSYGPGRYDPDYEEKGHDYPVGFVRWTEQRNFEAVLDMLAERRINVVPLISHRFPIEQADQAYELLGCGEPSLGILIEYQKQTTKPDRALLGRTLELMRHVPRRDGEVTVSLVGAGDYARRMLAPAFKAAGGRLQSVASERGVSCARLARKHGFAKATTDIRQVLDDPDADAIVIATRHDSHAELVIEALRAGKHVFVEKPLCLTEGELDAIDAAYRSQTEPRFLMVGFNRRFAPHVRKIKSLLAPMTEPKSLIMTVNAGAIPASHWSQDQEIGGGRIIGEACHFIDLLRYLTGAPITSFSRTALSSSTNDTASLQLAFADGSIGTVHYFANGSRRFSKERLEVFCGGRILQLDNFRKARGFGWQGFTRLNLWRQDKGQHACVAAFVEAIGRGKPTPIPYEEIYEVARVSIELARP
jgi:predicted dehydrogenase/threonine dehydrogenase-like Zn-dependent dehydrogenase